MQGLSLPYYHLTLGRQNPVTFCWGRIYEYPNLLINGGEQWIPIYFRRKASNYWTITVEAVKDETNSWHGFPIWGDCGTPKNGIEWSADMVLPQQEFQLLFSIISNSPAVGPTSLSLFCLWSDLSFPAPTLSKVMPILHPMTLRSSAQGTPHSYGPGGEALLYFSFILLLLLFFVLNSVLWFPQDFFSNIQKPV